VLKDALLGWPLLKERGFIIFDDYLWHHVDCPHFSAETGANCATALLRLY
jgi:hypothetical protein